jgi:hypothetical protein
LLSYDSPTRPPPFSTSPVSKLSLFLSLFYVTVSPVDSSSLLTGVGGGRGRGAKSYDREKAWPSIHHSILSSPTTRQTSLPPPPHHPSLQSQRKLTTCLLPHCRSLLFYILGIKFCTECTALSAYADSITAVSSPIVLLTNNDL